MSFLGTIFGGVSRDVKLGKLKSAFDRDYPGESMKGTLEGYCGTGMMVAKSINDGTQDRLRFIDAFEQGLALEQENHRSSPSRLTKLVSTRCLTSSERDRVQSATSCR